MARLHGRNNRKAHSELNPTSVAVDDGLRVGVFLERRWLRIRLAARRIAQRENHNRNFMRRTFATTRKNPGDEDQRHEDQSDEEIITVVLNQPIQKLGGTRDDFHRVFHLLLSGLVQASDPSTKRAFIMLDCNVYGNVTKL